MEDLNIKGLAAGMLAKFVQNAAWDSIVQKISYKAECAASLLIRRGVDHGRAPPLGKGRGS
jgi:hypothetical protein